MLCSRIGAFAQDAGMESLRRSWAAWWPVAAAVLLAGCGADPRRVLESMARGYRTAEHYSDDARVVVRHTQAGGTTEATHPFRVAFSRPDRLRVEAYDARVVGDGTSLFAAVGGVPGQVLVESIRSPLDMDQLFADDVVRGTLTEGEAGCPPQLALLLADDTLDVILADAVADPRIVGTETIDGRRCHHVSVAKADGALELWIDCESAVVRRMRVPTAAYADEASRQAGAPVGISVDVEFVSAAFAPPSPEAFAFEVPPRAAKVARLEPLDRPQPPHPLLGKPAGLPPLPLADGSAPDAVGAARGPVVLEFFFDACGPAAKTMPAVAAGLAASAGGGSRAAGAAAARHFAVSLDPAEMTTAEIRRRLAEFGGVGTLVRDPEAAAARALGLEAFPATVIVAGDGTVADVIVGERTGISADVAETLAALARGDATAPLVQARHRRRLDDYRRTLAGAATDAEDRRGPEPAIAPQRQPDRFKLRPVWRAAVALPGNLECLDSSRGSGQVRIVALDGWRTVVEFDADGVERGRHELDLPADAAVTFLKSATAADHRRWWLGGSRGGGQVFVFDDEFRRQAAYPPAVEAGTRISTADLADLDGDGTPELLVGFEKERGVEVVTLDGQLRWSDPSADPTTALAAAGGDGVLLINRAGRPGRASPDGAAAASPPTAERTFSAIRAGPVAADGGWAVAGLTAAAGGQALVGLDPRSLDIVWDLPLAAGPSPSGAVEPIAWADLLGTSRRQWLAAAADGSVTVAWADGRIVDRYCHGRPLVGIGGYRHGDRGHLVLATPAGIEAFAIEDVALD